MNILILTTHVNTGGITSYILTLGHSLVKSGHKVWVGSSGGDCVLRLEAAGIQHVKLDIRTKSEVHPKLLLSLPALVKLVQKEKIDIIHAQTRVTQVMGHWLGWITDVKMVTTCHGFFKPRWFRKTFPCWGSAVIAISNPVAQHLNVDFGVSQHQIYLIPNGIDLECFVLTNEERRRAARQGLDIKGGVPTIGIIARLSDVKGIDILIKAMPFILNKIPSAQLMIVGQGPEESNLKKLTQDLILSSKIHFINTTGQTQDILPAFDVFVMPSLMEGLGLSVMEAQACGIPVVASRVGGLFDLIEDGENGHLVEPKDPLGLAQRIVEVLRHPDHAAMLAGRARSNIEKYFSAQLMAGKTLEVYEQYSRR